MFAFVPLLGLLLVGPVIAANDWSKPCLSDACEYDLPSTNGTSSGTLKIWGAKGSISDITAAAGWEIIDCSPDSLQQDIRLVCKNNSSSSCANLYSGSSGAVGKVVRLPENCGKAAFAVVTKSYTPDDQSIPADVASSLARRDGSKPTVQGLSLTTKWASVKTPSTGPVNFAIRAANVPGASGDIDTTPQNQRRRNSRIYRRGAVSDFITGAVDDISSLNDFNVTNNEDLPPFDIDKTFNLFNQTISCPPVDAGVKVDVDAKAHAVASIGVAASGTVLPPAVSDFAVIINLNAELDGELLMNAQASGTLDSGKIPLFEVGIPGLDFPGILTIGPSFTIDAQATASLDVNLDMTVGIKYKVVNAQLTFPPNVNGKNGGAFNIEDTPLLISASPDATATGTLEAHLIPSLNLGVSALGDVVDASVFLELDASASMKLTANAQASESTQIGRRSLVHPVPRHDSESAPAPASVPANSTATSTNTTDTPGDAISSTSVAESAAKSTNNAHATSTAATSNSTATSTSTSSTDSNSNTNVDSPSQSSGNASFSGCFEIGGALDVNAGATGSFFDLFDANTKVNLFSKDFEIFKKCFGASTAQASRRGYLWGRSIIHGERSWHSRADSLTCPEAADASDNALQTIIDQTIGASSIQVL